MSALHQQQLAWHLQSQAGDKDAREKLIDSVLPLAYRVVGTIPIKTGSFDREDAKQEAAAAVSFCVDAWGPERGMLSTFVYKCVKNHLYLCIGDAQFIRTYKKGQEFKKVVREQSASRNSCGTRRNAETVDPRGQPDDDINRKEAQDLIREAVAGLPETWQQIIYRKLLDGAGDAEIAAELGFTNVCSVKTLRDRALKRLSEDGRLRKLAEAYGWLESEGTHKAPAGTEAGRAA